MFFYWKKIHPWKQVFIISGHGPANMEWSGFYKHICLRVYRESIRQSPNPSSVPEAGATITPQIPKLLSTHLGRKSSEWILGLTTSPAHGCTHWLLSWYHQKLEVFQRPHELSIYFPQGMPAALSVHSSVHRKDSPHFRVCNHPIPCLTVPRPNGSCSLFLS